MNDISFTRRGLLGVSAGIAAAAPLLGSAMLSPAFAAAPMLGAARPVHILTPSATVRRIVNMSAWTAVDINSER